MDMERVQIQSNRENLEQAFEIAERLGVTRLLDAEGGRPARAAGEGGAEPSACSCLSWRFCFPFARRGRRVSR